MMAQAVPLLPAGDEGFSDDEPQEPSACERAARRERYYVLAVFSLFAFAQGALWLTFSSVDHERLRAYYSRDITFGTVALLLNWGPIIGILSFPATIWIMKRPDGFHEACIAGMALCVSGAAVRLIPTIAGARFRGTGAAILLLHAGQILNAAGGPLCMATTSRLSSIWFPEDHRTFSTAIAIAANSIGTNVAFILGPYVSQAGGVGALLYLGLGLTLLPAVLAMIHLPKWPSHIQRGLPAPILVRVQGLATPDVRASESPSLRRSRRSSSASSAADAGLVGSPLVLRDVVNDLDVSCLDNGEDGGSDTSSIVSSDSHVVPPSPDKEDALRLMMSNRNFVLTVLCGGCIAGLATAWQTMLQSILKGKFDETTIGWIGCFNGMAANLGNILAGAISQRDRIQVELVIGLGLQVCALGLFVDAAQHSTFVGVFTAVLGTGLTYGLCSPLFYELSAKLIFPVNEGVSISVLVFLLNCFACMLTALAPLIGASKLTGVFITGLIVAVLVMFFCVNTDESNAGPLPDQEAPASETPRPPSPLLAA